MMSKRGAALAAWLMCCLIAVGVRGEEAFPTSVVTEVSVSDTEAPDVWVSLSVYSEQPFLATSDNRTIYTHPDMPFGAAVDSFEFDGEDDPRIYQKRQIFGYKEYVGTTALSDGVSDVAAAFLPPDRVSGVVFWKYLTLDRTIITYVHYKPLYLGVQSKAPDGTIITSTYPLAPDRIQNITSVYEYLDATYEISLYHYQDGVPTVPVPDTQARVGFFAVNYPAQTLLYATPWATTNAAGRADSTMGSGSYTIPISGNVPLDTITVRIDPLKEDGSGYSTAYQSKEITIEDMATFDGQLTVTVTDVDDTPLRATVTCTGGPIHVGASSVFANTDSSGVATIRIPSGGSGSDVRSVDAHIAPKVLVISNLTQFIDNLADSELHAHAPVYFSPHFQLMEGAYTYKGKAPEDAIVRIYANGTQEGGDEKSRKIKRDEDYTRGDRLKGLNRLFWSVTPGETGVQYTARVYFEDDDEGAPEEEMLAGDTEYTPRTVSETRVPIDDTPLNFRYVGVVGLGTPPPSGHTVLGTYLSGAQQAEWNTFLEKLVPQDVIFSNGGDVTPKTWFFERDGYRIGGTFRELENWRRAQTPYIDVVVGIVAPGGASSYLTGGASGLSLDGYEHVILIDPAAGLSHRKHILLHEYLHTLGLPDDLSAPPSANGYDPDTGRPVYNGMGIQTAQGIMFDAATEAWPTTGEYETLLDRLTVPLLSLTAKKPKARERDATPTRVMNISALLHRVPSDSLIGAWEVEVAQRAPVFIDTALPYAPQEAPPNNGMNGRAYGVTLTDNVTFSNSYYHLMPQPTVNDDGDPVLDENLLGFVDFNVPWNEDTSSIGFGSYTYTGSMSGIIHGCEITKSANAPTVAWTSKPTAGATLSDQVTFEWQTDDPDYGPTLYAWVKVSTDDGATWKAAGNYFAIDEGTSSFVLDCDLFPSSSNCRIKILVTDDWYTRTLEAGPYTLDGYNPNPAAQLAASGYNVSVRTPAVVTFPLALSNTGGASLDVSLATGSLPAWLSPLGGKTTRRIVPGGEEAFFFSCSSTITQPLSGSVSLATNDPGHTSLAFPVSITFDDQDHAPQALWLKASDLTDGARTISPSCIIFQAQEIAGRSDLDATLTIRQRFPYDRPVAADVAMGPGQRPGEYRLDWEPGSLQPGRYGVEVALADSVSGLSDTDGSNPSGDDFTFEIVGENHAPVFSSVSPVTDPMSHASILGGANFTLNFAVSDPDGDPLTLSLECEMPAEIDAVAGTISGITTTDYVGEQTVRLVATDPHGARTAAVWYIDVDPPWVPDIARAVPDVQNGTIVTGDTFRIGAKCYNLDPQQGCRVDYRPEGASGWTTIATSPYANQEYYVQYTNSYAWDVTHLTPGAPCELRYVNINASGQEDAEPPVVVIRRTIEDAAVTRVSAPANLWPGQRFTLFVEVLNRSTQAWTPTAGYHLVAQSGADPLTGAASIALPEGISVPPGAKALYSIETTAPLTPGRYTTSWQHATDAGAYGTGGSVTVSVGSTALPEPREAAWMLY